MTTKKKRQNRILSDFYIADGLIEDCDKFFSLFLEKDNLSFSTFADLWKSSKMAQIFIGRQSYAELLGFTEEALITAKKYFLQGEDFKKQVFGLYLMYTFYYRQPFKTWEKLKFTRDDCKKLYDIKQILKSKKALEPLFILCKMLNDGAIIFCTSEEDYSTSFENKFTRSLNTFKVKPNEDNDGDIVSDFKNLHKQLQNYKESKRDITDETGKPLEILNTNLATDMIEVLKKININPESEHVNCNVQRDIKERAFRSAGESSNPRYRQQKRKISDDESDEDSSED